MDHSQATTMHYLAAKNSLEDGYWDEVYREIPYNENQDAPHPPKPEYKGREVGEFDILLVNYDDKNAYYKEVKTSKRDMAHASRQLDRAEEHFEGTGWDIIKNKVLED